MKAFGYEKGKDSENLLHLKEMSILCNIGELEKIISFLQEVKRKHESVMDETEMCHSHYQDWDPEWRDNEADLIIVTER